MEANPPRRVWAAVSRLWWRARPRRMTWALVVLGIVAGATAGVSLAALDGARRTGSVIERSAAATKEPDVLIAPDRPDFDWRPIQRLPEIEAIGLFGGPVCALDVGKGELCGSVLDRVTGVDISTTGGVGRAPNPDRADEVAVNRSAAKHYHLAVGDTFTIVSATPAQIRQAFKTFVFPSTAEFAGPKVKVHVVAVVEPGLSDRLLGDVDSIDTAEFYATDAYGKLQKDAFPDGAFVVNAMARLKPGTNVDAFRRHVGQAAGDPTIPVRDLAQDESRYDRTLLIERTALTLLAVVLALVGAVLIGQALTRLVRTSATGSDTLMILGASRATAVGVVVAPYVLTVGAAIVTALAVAAVASTRFPIGTARLLEPDRGVHLDPLVLSVGIALLVLALVACIGLVARNAVYRRHGHLRRARKSPSVGLPLPVELGMRLAVSPGGSGVGAASVPAIIGAVIGILGIVGAMTFRAGIDDVVAHNARAGTTWNRVVNLPNEGTLPSLTDVAGVRAAAEVKRGEVAINGETMSAWSYESKTGDVKRVVIEGRLPAGPDEATLGWSSARSLGVKVGDHVTSANGANFSVVGIGLLPEQPGHSPYDRGLWVTTAGLGRFGEGVEIGDHELLVSLDTGRGATALSAALRKGFGFDLAVGSAVSPAGARDMVAVRRLPLALAVFLAILAAGVSIHALVNTLQRRRRDLAVFRALGLTPRQARVVISSQATTIGLVGLVIGVPLGIVIGRAGWQWVARSVPFVYRAPFAVVALIVVVPAALAALNVVALVPGRAAARVHPAEVLRTE